MTLSELKTAVLQELGVLSPGESATAADGATVSTRYSELYEMLLTEGLVSWAAEDDIPTFAARPITWMVAFLCVGDFGVPASKKQELAIKGALSAEPISLAERNLRRQLAKGFVYAPVVTEYF